VNQNSVYRVSCWYYQRCGNRMHDTFASVQL